METLNGLQPVAGFMLLLVVFILSIPILGSYLAKVFGGKPHFLSGTLGWLERFCYRAAGVDPREEMTWVSYGKALLLFNCFGFLALLLLQMGQGFLFFNPQGFGAPSWHLAFNTAISFTTNTNWQAYAGETTLSYLTQMTGLTVQNFLSAATGMGVMLALIRGLLDRGIDTIGNFWADIVRAVVYLFLPLSCIFALVLVQEGVVQTLAPYAEASTLEGGKQTIPLGPAASQVAIKQLGTNGGGFFNANSAHPLENPTPFSNFLQTFAILLIPGASVYTYGVMIDRRRHAILLLLAMFILWFLGLGISFYSESLANPALGLASNVEGKEVRFGIFNSVLWSVSTTATSNGSVNAIISSLSPLAGGAAVANIMLGEMIFGGAGVGLCSMIMFTLLTVFLSGLMVGRTPEYLGKKIEKQEMQLVMAAILTPGALILIGAGISAITPVALQSLANPGPHGLSEILYAFSSAAGNNGSAFAGLDANTVYYNVLLGICMLLGRVSIVLPSLALAGVLAKKRSNPPSKGTFETDTLLFLLLLLGTIVIVGALTFYPALSLGPVIEQFLMFEGRTF